MTTLTLTIIKQGALLYEAVVEDRGQALGEPSMYPTIADAIRGEAGDFGEPHYAFIDIFYSGMSSGTWTLLEAAQQAEEIAARLVGLVADGHAFQAQQGAG